MFRRLLPAGCVAALALLDVSARAGQTVVDAGTSFTFTVPAISTNYAWRMEGTLVSTNGIVGTNGPNFTYAPTRFDVGTHELACFQTLSNGVASNSFWQVRVRIPLPASATNYYVATNGSDGNAGTLASPFLTLERARNAIRTNGLPAGGVTVYLRGGTYFRTNTFLLTNSDSGTMTSPVVYAGYPGETAVISAGKPVLASAFVPLDSSQTNRVPTGVSPTNILEMDIPTAGITHRGPFPAHFGTWVTTNVYGANGSSGSASGGICDLFYNDQRMWLSRYPNHDLTNDNVNTTYLLMDGVATTGSGSTNYLNSAGIYTNSSGSPVSVGCAFHYYPSDAGHVTNWVSALANGGAWVSGFWRVDWQNDALQILGIDADNQVIEITNTASAQGGIGSKYQQPLGSLSERYWVMNLLEEMDQPGEWAIDFNRKKIYFYAPTNQLADGSVIISDFALPLAQLSAATNVVFQSLTFEDGLAQGILIGTNCQNNLVAGCTFQNMNNYALDISGYTNGVVSCLLQNLAGGGVLLHGGNASSSPRVPARNFVVNNIITNSGVIARVYNTPVDVGGNGAGGGSTNVVGMRIAHNFLTVMPHLGILHGTTWDTLVEYNNLFNFGQISSGIGGIYGYTFFTSSGNNYFRYNFVHDSPNEDGITFDQDHRQAHVYCNVVDLTVPRVGEQQCLATETGSQATAGEQQYLDHYNNLGLNSNNGLIVVSPTGSTIEENAMINCWVPYTWQQVVIGVSSNTFVNSSAAVLQSGPNLAYTNDPGFINYSNEDFRLVPSSTVYSDMPQFVQLPFEMMGLYNDESWSNAIGYSPYPTTTPASALGPGSATLNGTLVYPQFDVNSTVFVYWGTNDGGTNLSAWTNVLSFGVQGAGNFSTNLTGLAHVPYFYRFFATNAYGQSWAPASASFTPYFIGHAPANLAWKGDGVTNVWDGNTNNLAWLNASTPAPFWDGDTVTFNDAGTNTPAINLAATVQPAFVEVNAAKNYTFAGAGKISGITSLQKDGGGTLFVLTTNDYTGATTINGGTVQVGDGTNSGTLGGGNITNNAALVFNQPGNSTVSGSISGTGGLTQAGTGTLTLAANNTYTGATAINNGAVAIVADANLGAGGAALSFNGGALQITSGGLFTLNNRAITLNAGGGTFNFANTLTVTNPITGPGALTLAGGGTTIFTASNTYAGNTVVNAGLLQVDNGNATGSVPTNIVLNGGDLLFTRPDTYFQNGFISGSSINSSIGNLATGGQLTLNFAAGSNTLGTVVNSSGNALVLVGGANYLLPLGTDLANAAAYGTLVVSNGYWFTPRIGGNGGPYMLGTNIIANATLETSGARGVKGIFQIQNGGVLRLDSAHYPNAVNENRFDLGSSGMGAGETTAITISSGGTLDIWSVQYDGFNLNPAAANTVASVTQNGGTTLVGINGTSNSLKNVVFNAAGSNSLAAFQLNGGLLKVAGTVSATAPAAGGTNLFLFNGGTLAVNTFNATNLTVLPANSLVNLGGTLAPGDAGTPGATFIQGNYVCSNATALAIDLGGTNQATAFTNAANYYDFVSVSGTAALNGALNVSLLNNFVPATNNSFTILTNGGGLAGAFANVVNGRVPAANYAGGSFLVVTTATSVVLTNFQVLLASFTASATNGASPLPVTFTDTSLGTITNRAWNFGDGFTTNLAGTNLSHTFTVAGTNFVSLTVSGTAGTSTNILPVIVTAPAAPPVIGGIKIAGGNLILTGSNGTAGANYYVLAATNVALPRTNWTVLATNQFGPGGNVNFTNPFNPNAPQWFYLLKLP